MNHSDTPEGESEVLLSEGDKGYYFATSLSIRRRAWPHAKVTVWMRRVNDHYDYIIDGNFGNVEYTRVAAIEVIDGLDHYDFDPTHDQERRLISAVLWFDPNVFPVRVAMDFFDDPTESVYTVLIDDDLTRLVLDSDWNALNHAGALASAGKLASVAHLKELLSSGATRSLAEGVL